MLEFFLDFFNVVDLLLVNFEIIIIIRFIKIFLLFLFLEIKYIKFCIEFITGIFFIFVFNIIIFRYIFMNLGFCIFFVCLYWEISGMRRYIGV